MPTVSCFTPPHCTSPTRQGFALVDQHYVWSEVGRLGCVVNVNLQLISRDKFVVDRGALNQRSSAHSYCDVVVRPTRHLMPTPCAPHMASNPFTHSLSHPRIHTVQPTRTLLSRVGTRGLSAVAWTCVGGQTPTSNSRVLSAPSWSMTGPLPP